MATQTVDIPEDLQPYWSELDCGFPRVGEVFPDCMRRALSLLTGDGVAAYIEHARFLGKMGRGAEPILIFLEEWPEVAMQVGEDVLPDIMQFIRKMSKSPNSKAITPFLQSLPVTARRLQTRERMSGYLAIALDLMERTTSSVHGIHQTFPSPGLPEMFKQVPVLLAQLSLNGLKNWVDYGVRYYDDHPERQTEYFSLQSADSRAVLQRERHGTLLVDNDRKLGMYLRGLWEDGDMLIPFSGTLDESNKPIPYYDKLGIRLPDVFDDANGIVGIDRYRAALAHIMGHRRWTRAIIADNMSPFQRMAAEFLEDSRVEYLAMREYPGLRRIFTALHPVPHEDACDPESESTVRHRLAMLSRAILDPRHPYKNKHVNEFAQRFHALMAESDSGTQEMADLGISFIARTRLPSDNFASTHFTDTVVEHRDDNRQMWKFIEEGDEEEAFDEPRKIEPGEELQGLPPRHYHEWDYNNQSYRPDWVSV
ncbi:MAG: hypothetical protein Q8L69_08065, partial [Gallionellaceae bacterium]|nr:hypothetical protein [Gallionellaceae bacterium]